LEHPKANKEEQDIIRDKIKAYEKAGKDIIYIDESGFAHDMPRRHGYAPIGKRCFGTQDWHAKGRTNVIGALLFRVLLTVSLFSCNVNSDVFYGWLTQDLLPKIKKQSVIVLDNASFHKRKDIQDAILNDKHILIFLPPYSPQLNPIEHKWAQAQAIRKQKHCSIDELFFDYKI